MNIEDLFEDFKTTSPEGKLDMFEESVERMITAEKEVSKLRHMLEKSTDRANQYANAAADARAELAAMRERLADLEKLVEHHKEHHAAEERLPAIRVALQSSNDLLNMAVRCELTQADRVLLESKVRSNEALLKAAK